MNALLARQLLFFGGKGGVGKTTCSSAFALAASVRGRRVLLVSTDPAHSISDIFEQSIGSEERCIQPGLWALEIDAERELSRYVAQVKVDLERMFAPGVIRQASRQIDMAASSPGLVDVALLDRMVDLIVEGERRYDMIVFDTAPAGHTIQLLRMPEVMDTWIRALVRHRRALLEIDQGTDSVDRRSEAGTDPVIEALERRHDRLKILRERILDRTSTSFVLVTIPERLAIEESARTASLLQETGLSIAALIVNRVLPGGLTGEFYVARRAQEQRYLEEFDRRFHDLARTVVPQLARDVYGLESLSHVSRLLFGEA